MRVARIALTAAIMLMAASSLADAGTGTVHITFAKAGLFLGAGKGSGTLHFHSQSYALDVSGFSIGTIGFGVTKLKGHAHNLRHAADIVGTYTAASVSMAVAAGGKVARLQNANGVVYLQLEGPEVGLELSAALAGLTISLGSH
jgi:hypothetical protein